MAESPVQETQMSRVTWLLASAEREVAQGNQQRAYQLSLQATEIAPHDAKTWLMRAETAPSWEEIVACLNRVNTIAPRHSIGKQKTLQVVQLLLQSDPFLAYLDEGNDLYHVQNRAFLQPLYVPKRRRRSEKYPAEHPRPFQRTYSWMALAALGLLFSGLGTLIFAPLAMVAILYVSSQPLSSADRMRGVILIVITGGLWVCGVLLSMLLLFHLL